MPTPEDPLVILFIGCRGSGKSTQAKMAAEKYNLLHVSSGDLFTNKQDPFVALKKIVKEEFGPSGAHRYCGLALDRFIVRSEVDSYYLQNALHAASLPVPLVVWLRMDFEVGLQRAADRDEQKDAAAYWRSVELRVQSQAAEGVYRPIGSLLTVDAVNSKEVIFSQVTARIKHTSSGRSKKAALPKLMKSDDFDLLSDYEVYTSLCKDIHAAVQTKTGRIDAAPLSTMAAYIDRGTLSTFKKESSPYRSSFVTLKADGERYLLVKCKGRGLFAFPFKFSHCFSLNCPTLKLPNGIDGGVPLHPTIEFVLDTEFCILNGKSTFFVIDFVYFYGCVGTQMRFAQRYGRLCNWMNSFEKNVTSPVIVQLKTYVPINRLVDILPSLDAAPFPIDGVVFQHGDVYVFGKDRLLAKWKPKELCTVDFRLRNGRQNDEYWTFDLYVSANTGEEEALKGAVVAISNADVNSGVRDHSIVELSLLDKRANGTTWEFHRRREDKLFPNKNAIAKQIIDMDHLVYPEVVSLTSQVPFVELPESQSSYFSHR